MKSNPPSEIALLIRLLAQSDAVFIPHRDPGNPAWSHVWVARWTYAKSGVKWRAGGDDAHRKSAERLLVRLRAAGLVRVWRPGGRTSSVRLTLRGQCVARALAHLRPIADAVELVQLVHSLRDDAESSKNGSSVCHVDSTPWLPETLFTDPPGQGWGNGNQAALSDVNFQFAFPSALGWTESNSDALRHVRHRLTPAGLAIATGAAQPPASPHGLPGRVEALEDLYDAERDSARAELWSRTERLHEIGAIPLPCSFKTKGTA